METVLETRRVLLRQVGESDSALLEDWKNTEEYRELVFDGKKQKLHSQFLICLKRGGIPIGTVYTFSYNEADGYMFLNVFLSDGYRKRGYGAEACILLICHLFDQLPIHKLYCDALTLNTPSVSMMKGAGLEQEGFLRDHRFYNGKRYDVSRFAVHRENLAPLRTILKRAKER